MLYVPFNRSQPTLLNCRLYTCAAHKHCWISRLHPPVRVHPLMTRVHLLLLYTCCNRNCLRERALGGVGVWSGGLGVWVCYCEAGFIRGAAAKAARYDGRVYDGAITGRDVYAPGGRVVLSGGRVTGSRAVQWLGGGRSCIESVVMCRGRGVNPSAFATVLSRTQRVASGARLLGVAGGVVGWQASTHSSCQ